MLYSDIQALSIHSLIAEIGETIETDIKTKHLKKQDVAKMAGINYMSLYRLLNGENYSIDSLLKVLKVLEKYDAIDSLITPIPINPIDLYPKLKKGKKKQNNNLKSISIDDINSNFEEESEWTV